MIMDRIGNIAMTQTMTTLFYNRYQSLLRNRLPHSRKHRMTNRKKPSNFTRLSSINPGGIKTNDIQSKLQHALDLDITIQAYSEVNLDTTKPEIREKLEQVTRKIDPNARSIWGSSKIPSENDYKLGGTGIASFGAIAGNIKQSGNNEMGRWSYQIFDSQKKIDIIVISIYQCCISPTNKIETAAYHQQQIMLLGQDRTDTNPKRNFRKDLLNFLEKHLSNLDKPTIPCILGDWNEPHEGQSTSKKYVKKLA